MPSWVNGLTSMATLSSSSVRCGDKHGPTQRAAPRVERIHTPLCERQDSKPRLIVLTPLFYPFMVEGEGICFKTLSKHCDLSFSAAKDRWTLTEKEKGPPRRGEQDWGGGGSPLLKALQPMERPHSQPPSDSSPPGPDPLFPDHKPSTPKITTYRKAHAEMEIADMPAVVKLQHQIQPSETLGLRREASGSRIPSVGILDRSRAFGMWCSGRGRGWGWGGVPPLLPIH